MDGIPVDICEKTERHRRHARMLAELAEIGMKLAREVGRQASGEADAAEAAAPVVQGDLGLVYSRIARAVRQTVALEARLADDAAARGRQEIAPQGSRGTAQRAQFRRQKDRVHQLVTEAIQSEAEGRDREGLLLDLDERLTDPDIEAELGDRPVGLIVLGICSDLGIEADLSHFSDAELAVATRAVQAAQGVDGRDKPGQDEGGPSPWPPPVKKSRDPP